VTESQDEFNWSFLEKIPLSRLKKIWKSKFSDKPFPNVRAFILEENEFIKTLQRLHESPCFKDTRIIEWGRKTPLDKISGCVFQMDTAIILVKQNSPYPIDDDLEHELRHIYSGEVKSGQERRK